MNIYIIILATNTGALFEIWRPQIINTRNRIYASYGCYGSL